MCLSLTLYPFPKNTGVGYLVLVAVIVRGLWFVVNCSYETLKHGLLFKQLLDATPDEDTTCWTTANGSFAQETDMRANVLNEKSRNRAGGAVFTNTSVPDERLLLLFSHARCSKTAASQPQQFFVCIHRHIIVCKQPKEQEEISALNLMNSNQVSL